MLRVKFVWALAALIGAFLFAWPFASGYAFIHDEHKYCIWAFSGRSPVDNLVLAWMDRQYRVLDLVAGYLCNPNNLDAQWTMLLQLPPFAVILYFINAAARRLAPDSSLAAPVALVWFMVHTATAVSLWLPTVGQTWSAAAGLLLALVVWNCLAVWARGERASRSHWWAVLGIGLIGPHLKETYYGWAMSITAAILIVWIHGRHTRSSWSGWNCFRLAAAVVTPALLHAATRIVWGGLGKVNADVPGRHHVQLGMNLIKNIGLSVAGLFSVGPVHYIGLSDQRRAIACIGLVLSAGLALVAFRGAFSNDTRERATSHRLILLSMTSLFAVSATWPMSRISELYLMGPNAGIAVVVGIGVARALAAVGKRKRYGLRMLILGTAAIGFFGFVSRVLHFRTSWKQGTQLYARALQYQRAADPALLPQVVCLDQRLFTGWYHSQYVMPPASALNVPTANELLRIVGGERHITMISARDASAPCRRTLDGSNLPPRNDW